MSRIGRTVALSVVLCCTTLDPRTVEAQGLYGTSINISWWDTSVPGFCCQNIYPFALASETTISGFANLFDIILRNSEIVVTATNTVSFSTFFQLTFLFQPGVFPNPTTVGPGASQIGCCGYVFAPKLGGWQPWFGLGFGPSGTGQPFTLNKGTTIPVAFRFTTPFLPRPPALPGPVTTPEPGTLLLVASGLAFLSRQFRRRPKA